MLCVVCRGLDCDLTHRCKICESWSDATMQEYTSHYAKLEVKRGKKQAASQGAATKSPVPPAPDRDPVIDPAALKEDIRRDLQSYFDRRMEENSSYIVKELKNFIKAGKGKTPVLEEEEGDDDELPPETPVEDLRYTQDSRYVDAKRLFDCGALDSGAFNNIILMCKADVVNVDVADGDQPDNDDVQ